MNREEIKIFLMNNFNNRIMNCYQILRNKHNNIYNHLINETSYLDKKIKFTERLYHIVNDLYEIPKCKNCEKNTVKFNGYIQGYSGCCSVYCSNIFRTINKKYCFNGNINRHEIKDFLVNYIGFENIINSYQTLKYKFINVYNGILELTIYLENVPFNERLYHIINDMYEIPKCKNCRKNIVKFNGYYKGYLSFCSYKCSSNNVETRNKCKHTCFKKYGKENIFQIEDIKNSSNKKFLDIFIPILTTKLKYLNIELLDKNYKNEHFQHKWKCLKCNNEFNQTWNEIQQGYLCPNCFLRNRGYSINEKELVNFIQPKFSNIIENSRNIINPYELDIFIPEKNIAIEFNGLYYHSEIFKDKNYHLNKTNICQSKNIQLIHIFEDEWLFKNDIVKSRLKQIFGINNSKRIHARKCKIREIHSKDKNLFLNKYHIQGGDRSNIKLGAFYDDVLISVMTFSLGSIAKGSKLKNEIYELSRFCSSSDYHTPGIASKLLEYFKRNYEWKEIFSYADRRWSLGNLYYKIGFELCNITKPNYWYIKNQNRIHRFNLRKKYNEPKNIPEWVLRSKEGYYRIWDCGHLKFIMRKINNENN